VTVQPCDVFDLLNKIRYDTTAIQAKLTDAINALRELNLSEQPVAKCPHCELETRGERTLAEHLHNLHDGPIPEYYAAIESRSLDPEEPEEDE